jgi:MurNAc alpha-1-phosphate uridylyltransferase
MIDTLVIFAAGFGRRLLPITQDLPKPLIEVAGKPLLYHALDLALKFKFRKIIINTHYLHNLIEEAVAYYIDKFNPTAEIIMVYEPTILETGGAIKNVYNLLNGSDAIFTLNSDSIVSCDPNIWHYMIEEWSPLEMDFMLLLTAVDRSFGTVGRGDFDINSDQTIHRNNEIRSFMYSGLQILKPDLINQNISDIFSISQYYKDSQIKLSGYVNTGHFYHISNMVDYEITNKMNFHTKPKAKK